MDIFVPELYILTARLGRTFRTLVRVVCPSDLYQLVRSRSLDRTVFKSRDQTRLSGLASPIFEACH